MEQERLIDIETKLGYQDVLLEELHQVLYRQQAQIDQLETALKLLLKRLPQIDPVNEKPPHY